MLLAESPHLSGLLPVAESPRLTGGLPIANISAALTPSHPTQVITYLIKGTVLTRCVASRVHSTAPKQSDAELVCPVPEGAVGGSHGRPASANRPGGERLAGHTGPSLHSGAPIRLPRNRQRPHVPGRRRLGQPHELGHTAE